METEQPQGDRQVDPSPHFTEAGELPEGPAWEQVDIGRYMPRRIRGSYRGRALG